MIFRDAQPRDIAAMHRVRLSVTENALSNPNLVTPEHYTEYLTQRGKGWVCEIDDDLVGFAIADVEGHSIWALFVDPVWEGNGIGQQLHRLMLDWYFSKTAETVWLTTAPQSRAEAFYRRRGWMETGRTQQGELRFELSREH